MTRFFALTAAVVAGGMAVASSGASARGFGGPMGNFGTVGTMQKVNTREIVNTPDKFVMRKIENRERREFLLRELFWRHHRHVLVKPPVLGPGPVIIP